MRRNSFHHHVPAEDHVLQPQCHMSRAMSRQMDDLKRTKLHIPGFVGEVNGNGLIKGLGKTGNAEELLTRLFSETSIGQERSEAATRQRHVRRESTRPSAHPIPDIQSLPWSKV